MPPLLLRYAAFGLAALAALATIGSVVGWLTFLLDASSTGWLGSRTVWYALGPLAIAEAMAAVWLASPARDTREGVVGGAATAALVAAVAAWVVTVEGSELVMFGVREFRDYWTSGRAPESLWLARVPLAQRLLAWALLLQGTGFALWGLWRADGRGWVDWRPLHVAVGAVALGGLVASGVRVGPEAIWIPGAGRFPFVHGDCEGLWYGAWWSSTGGGGAWFVAAYPFVLVGDGSAPADPRGCPDAGPPAP